MKRLLLNAALLSATMAFGLASSTSVLAQDDPLLSEEEQAQEAQGQEAPEYKPFDPRASSIDEALEPTTNTPRQDAQDFFDSFNTEEEALDAEGLDLLGEGEGEGEGDEDTNLVDELLLEGEVELGPESVEGGLLDGDAAEGVLAVIDEEASGEDVADDAGVDEGAEVELETRIPFNPFAFGSDDDAIDEDSMAPIPDEDGISRIAIIRGLDKITARVRDVEVPVGRPVMFERFEILVQTCSRRPPEETPETTAFIQITEHRLDGQLESIFSGWMFASTPSINPVEHPVYDVWLIDCRTL